MGVWWGAQPLLLASQAEAVLTLALYAGEACVSLAVASAAINGMRLDRSGDHSQSISTMPSDAIGREMAQRRTTTDCCSLAKS